MRMFGLQFPLLRDEWGGDDKSTLKYKVSLSFFLYFVSGTKTKEREWWQVTFSGADAETVWCKMMNKGHL